MTAELISGLSGDGDPLLPDAPGSVYYLVPPSSCPPEYADVPIADLFAQIDAERQERTSAAAGESLTAGFGSRISPAAATQGSGSGFESGGVLDTSLPGAPLAGLAEAATRDGRLADLDDDELIGVLRAWYRLGSWCSSGLLTVIAELARRRPAGKAPPAPSGQFPAQLSEFVSDEVAAALTLTARMASTHADLALDLATRLPATARALHAGIIDHPKARLIAEATRVLTDDDARAVEARILAAAGQQTTGQLHAALARAVLAVDPEAATRRREEAQKDPRVRRWQEDAGTAALAGYGLPPAEVLAADQQLTTRALALRAAGLPGSLEELRARAYLDALLGRDSTPPPASPGQSAPPPADQPSPDPAPARNPQLAALVNLTLPLTPALSLAGEPGAVAGFGPIDPALSRHLLGVTATDPRTRFCLTITGQDGRAIGHGCARGQPPPASPSPPRSFTVTVSPLAQDSCDHRHEEPGYQPSRRLRHLVGARTPTCSAPGCRTPAARCDLDHTIPYDQGGRTCECGLAPLCRHHHRCKQSEGWRLEQSSPGTMHWTTPAGRHYTTTPGIYP